jgi:DNA-binding transcriptional ArsR family regulator
LPASELAAAAGVARSTASVHLDKLHDAGWLAVEAQGRHRYYRLADPGLVTVLEALARVSPPRPVHTLTASLDGDALRAARLCYDHLAGRLGTALTDALVAGGVIRRRDTAFVLTRSGRQHLADIGFDLAALERTRRKFAYPCLDWTERRHHLAGALGAAVAQHCVSNGWVRRGPTRAVRVTDEGRRHLRTTFGVDVEGRRAS